MDPYRGAEVGLYRLDRKVGEGAFGAVWSGTHVERGDRAAFKVLLPAAAANPEQVTRFRREGNLLARVESANVARMLDLVVDERFGIVLVMELIEGELLSDLLKATPLSARDTLDLGIQMLAGVRDLHAVGIIHRDLKPDNVMLSGNGTTGPRRVVIFDLGLSRLLQGTGVNARDPAVRSITPSFVALGSLECSAPEQILNAKDVTERSDLYAVGSVLFYAMTGKFPFSGGDGRALAQRKVTTETPAMAIEVTDLLAVRLRDIVSKATRRRPAERFASATEMREALELLQKETASRDSVPDEAVDPGDSMPSASRPSLSPSFATRRRGLRLVGILLATVLASALVWSRLHR